MNAIAPLLLLLPAQAPAPAAQETAEVAPERVERRLAAMGTWLALDVRASERASALQASEQAVRAIEAVEARLTTWRDDSELARLNHAVPGTAVELSRELAADLARATQLERLTEGAFDAGVGPLVAAWGLRSGGRQPSSEELARARSASGLRRFRIEGRSAWRLDPAAAIEEGGFGKGIGLDAALDALRARGVAEAAIDLGGQLAVLGAPVEATLADPRDRERAVLTFACPAGSLATSGNSERGIVVDGIARAHLLDPRTGAPADDFGSLTVWARDATTADGLSTGLYVLGPARAFRWRETHPELGVELVVLEPLPDGRLRGLASAGWRDLRALASDLDLQIVPEGPEALSTFHFLPPDER